MVRIALVTILIAACSHHDDSDLNARGPTTIAELESKVAKLHGDDLLAGSPECTAMRQALTAAETKVGTCRAHSDALMFSLAQTMEVILRDLAAQPPADRPAVCARQVPVLAVQCK